jgi:Ca2+-binding EF-hand superfamily protein
MITITRNIPNAFLAAAILFALSTGAALAQAQQSQPQQAQRANLGPADANNDGKISAAEAASVSAKSAAEIDSNHDNNITAFELKAEEDRMHLLELNRYLGSMDANHDGKISTAEFSAMDAARFKNVDRNNDGFVTPDEMRPQGQ